MTLAVEPPNPVDSKACRPDRTVFPKKGAGASTPRQSGTIQCGLADQTRIATGGGTRDFLEHWRPASSRDNHAR